MLPLLRKSVVVDSSFLWIGQFSDGPCPAPFWPIRASLPSFVREVHLACQLHVCTQCYHNGVFTSLGIMGKKMLWHQKVLVNDTSWHSDDSTSVRQLGPDFDNRVAQLVTYGLLVTHMNMVEHESFTQYKIINHHITYFTVDWRFNSLLASTLLNFKSCVLVNQL